MEKALLEPPLQAVLENCCHVNSWGPKWQTHVEGWLLSEPGWEDLFRKQLRDAIGNRSIPPELYRQLTAMEDVRTQDDVDAQLKKIWRRYYGEEFGPEPEEEEPAEEI
ncbi:MAG: hypothetical protein HY235_21745 [Acidobacteria bacterium]|nr:hypothetical protein [Acidobacteriota bacterium]